MAQLTVHRIGTERAPVLIVDRPGEEDRALRDAALANAYGPLGSPHFPGIRAEAPPAYAQQIAAGVGLAVAQAMGWERADLAVEASWFSLVTTRPRDLTLFQRLPHMDGVDADRIAVMHYLDADGGGTAFYRHRATGWAQVTADRHARYDAALRAEIDRVGEPPAAYRQGSDELFEEIFRVEAAPGRLALYPGTLLHSGVIPDPDRLSEDPCEGRLTINTFLRRA